MDDIQLLTAIAAGDDSALRELFARHAPWLAVRLRTALGAADVEDVVQETFIAVWRGAGRYRPDSAVGAWIWGIARRQAAMLVRRLGPATLDLALLDLPDTATDPADAVVTRAAIDAAVTALGPASPDGDAWRLLYVEDRPIAEVADLTGVPIGTVKSRAHRARRLLRLALHDPTFDGGDR